MKKLQVHKVREGSAVGSRGELPWGRTLMCARIRTAVEAAARSCGAYRRLPRDRLLESTRGAGQDASAAWHVTFQRKDSPGARIRIEVKALTGPRATCGGGSLLLVRRQGGVLPSVLWLSEGIRHPASSPRQWWRRQQGRAASDRKGVG